MRKLQGTHWSRGGVADLVQYAEPPWLTIGCRARSTAQPKGALRVSAVPPNRTAAWAGNPTTHQPGRENAHTFRRYPARHPEHPVASPRRGLSLFRQLSKGGRGLAAGRNLHGGRWERGHTKGGGVTAAPGTGPGGGRGLASVEQIRDLRLAWRSSAGQHGPLRVDAGPQLPAGGRADGHHG